MDYSLFSRFWNPLLYKTYTGCEYLSYNSNVMYSKLYNRKFDVDEYVRYVKATYIEEFYFSQYRKCIHKDSNLKRILYYYKECLHRINGPSYIQYFTDGNIDMIMYHYNGRVHRTVGPAIIRYRPDSRLNDESYYNYGKLHRTDGPAQVIYDINGNITNSVYYRNGVRI